MKKSKTKFEDLGLFLKEKRTQANVTQREVGLKLGHSNAQFISNIERGLCAPPLKMIKQLVRIYSIPVNVMIDRLLIEQRRLIEGHLVKPKTRSSKRKTN